MSATKSRSEESGSRREDVLAALRGGANAMTIVAIADQLAVHPNTVRFHLGTLVTDGRVERVEPGHNGPGRPPLMFRAVRGMDPGGTRRYLENRTGRQFRQRAAQRWRSPLPRPAYPAQRSCLSG